ncbi:hypothetical protein ACTZWW_13130 [Salinarimonas sp. NSM]|uniref:hypothetical protein n=1 Tax=Salinarimonas sp. NSM TaxID=3458003 RepID=UPI004036B556
MHAFIPRRLAYTENGERKEIADTEVLGLGGPVIVLGEPGMGKTELLKQLAEQAGTGVRRAGVFARMNAPARVRSNVPLVIDGVDQVASAQPGDAIELIAARLADGGSPPFILSCRVDDWRSSVARGAFSEYDTPLRELVLLPFSTDDAVAFLTETLGSERAAAVAASLEERGLDAFLENPLTLGFVLSIAQRDGALPDTRADLMTQAVEILRVENDDGTRVDTALARLGSEAALDAAGALFAAFLLGGAETIARTKAGVGEDKVLVAADVRDLPGAGAVDAILGSRLFKSAGAPGHVEPIHRTVAEYLGARWLALQAPDDRARARVLALMVVEGGVPASLRGLHAWLAHWPGFAEAVIDRDPLGMLDYGDAEGLSPPQARRLLGALRRLERGNPHFRNALGGDAAVRALGDPALVDDVRDVLQAVDVGFALRSLVLLTIRGSPVATALAPEIEAIALATEREFTYVERWSALQALSPPERVRTAVERLAASSGADDTHLALGAIGDAPDAYAPETMASAMLGHLGLGANQVAGEEDDDVRSSGVVHLFALRLSTPFAAPVLDALAARRLGCKPGLGVGYDLETAASIFMEKAIGAVAIGAPRLLRWLRILPRSYRSTNDHGRMVAEHIRSDDAMRREMQELALLRSEDTEDDLRLWHLFRVHPALRPTTDDAVHLLHRLAGGSGRGPREDAVWRDLLADLRGKDGLPADAVDAARGFASGDPAREAHLAEMIPPPPVPRWEVEENERRRQAEAERAENFRAARAHFRARETDMRLGCRATVLQPAKCYLGRFGDIDNDAAPPNRLADWLGEDLRDAAIAGFEATLFRDDLPSFADVADAIAEDKHYSVEYPILAGVAERVRTGRGIADLPEEVVRIARASLYGVITGDQGIAKPAAAALDLCLRRDPASYEAFARQLMEPSLAARATSVPGLWQVPATEDDHAMMARLAVEWLGRYSDLPDEVEKRLVDTALAAGPWAGLLAIAASRLKSADGERQRRWQALALVLDFETTWAALGKVGTEERLLIWPVRDLFGNRRQSGSLPAPPALVTWAIRQFRPLWPPVPHPTGGWSGDTNPWDASDFLHRLIDRLANDHSEEASTALADLAHAPEDGYTPHLRRALHEQRQARRERAFRPLTASDIRHVIENGPPATPEDLRGVVLDALVRVQERLRAADTDPINKYWRDDGRPRDEDTCTDRLIEDLEGLLSPELGRAPQAHMARSKEADILFTIGDMALPLETKGQWNDDLWTAAGAQLDNLYVTDWRAAGGIYLVYWFGHDVHRRKRPKPHPDGDTIRDAEALRAALEARLSPALRARITVVVLDLSRGAP